MIDIDKTLLCCALMMAVADACGQSELNYPAKPIRMIVPSAPGSGPDIMARAIAQKLTEALGQTIVTTSPGRAALSEPRRPPRRRPTAIR